jgi:hypothetical protein
VKANAVPAGERSTERLGVRPSRVRADDPHLAAERLLKLDHELLPGQLGERLSGNDKDPLVVAGDPRYDQRLIEAILGEESRRRVAFPSVSTRPA